MQRETPLSKSEAMRRIIALASQAEVMGANDYEPSAFKRLQQELEEGTLSPEAAISQAEEILNSKQDYH